MDRERLKEVFQDTLKLSDENEILQKKTAEMCYRTQLYFRNFINLKPERKTDILDIEIIEDTTYHCASKYVSDNKIAVLNFANAYHPGGGVVNGAMAQEECLCRSSNLFQALTAPYILENYYRWNKKYTGKTGTDAVVYSPDVTVFKTDDTYPVIMDMNDWFDVDVLTCAAPYYDTNTRHPLSLDELEKIFYKRNKNILEIASYNKADILVLGAFGCGAFNNPPELVARSFKRLLVDDGYGFRFKKVLFAIKKNNASNTNLAAFKEVFEEM